MNTVKSQSKSKSQSGRVKTFEDYLSEIKKQIDFFCEFEGTENEELAEELCIAMAKVMRLPDYFELSIRGKHISADIVKETFGLVTYKHIYHVIENFSKLDYPVKHISSYLRTALYNSVEEVEHSLVNDVNSRWKK